MERGDRFDAIVVGGGHNGLTAAAYLARAGLSVCALERRDVLGGACVTEEVWPGRRVSRASYVVSMLQPKVVEDLRLRDFGYDPIPLDPSYGSIADATPLLFFTDVARTQASIAQFSKRDAEAYPAFEDLLGRVAAFVRPLMLRPPPAPGSRRPGDLLAIVREGARAAGLSQREINDVYRVMTLSVADLLDEHFESDLVKGVLASTGVVGVWAGPRSPGTAYNLLHHALGELNGVPGLWGHVRGGMGAISQAIARSAEAAGAVVRTGAEVASIEVTDGRATGVTLADGEEIRAPLVLSGAHPRTTMLELVGAEHLPDEVATDLRRYRTRGGSVKVNLVLSEPPRYADVTAEEQAMLVRTGVALCPSIDYLERSWQDACLGRPAAAPYVEVEVPTSVDPSLTDDGSTIVTMFTQYGPHDEAGWPEGAREAYGDRCVEILARHAPNVPAAILEREVLAPPDLERIFGLAGGSIFQGEQDLAQMAFMRPAAMLAGYATPVHGLYLCGAGTHPGGGVTGCSGHNAAMRALRDRRAERVRARLRPARSGRAPAPAG